MSGAFGIRDPEKNKYARPRSAEQHGTLGSEANCRQLARAQGALLRGCSFACGRVQNAFAQAQRFWRRFHILIDVDVFDRALQGHPERRFQLNPFAFTLAAHVGEVLFLFQTTADLKLGRYPMSSSLTLATLPSMLLIPPAPFTDVTDSLFG